MSKLLKTAREMLLQRGALVEEQHPETLQLLLDRGLAQTLGLEELCTLYFGDDPRPNALRITLESDFVQRLQTVLGSSGRTLSTGITSANVPQSWKNLDQTCARLINLTNATYRLGGVSEAVSIFCMAVVHYVAVSEDKHEGVFPLAINLSSGAISAAAAGEFFRILQAEPERLAEKSLWWQDEQKLLAKKEALFRRRIERETAALLDPFVQGMNKRYNRDIARVRSYYQLMTRELERAFHGRRADIKENPEVLSYKRQAIENESRAKLIDLRRKYQMNIDIRIEQAAICEIPVARQEVAILRRKARRDIALEWNPLIRSWESPYCEQCGCSGVGLSVSDQDLQLYCAVCAAATVAKNVSPFRG